MTVLSYVEYTANVNVTATSSATAQTIVTTAACVVDGSTEVVIEYYCGTVQNPGGASQFTVVELWGAKDGGAAAAIGILGDIFNSAGGSQIGAPFLCRRIYTPTSGSYVYSARAWVNAGTGVINASTGGAGAFNPGYLRVVTGI